MTREFQVRALSFPNGIGCNTICCFVVCVSGSGDRAHPTVHVACVGRFVRTFVPRGPENNHLGTQVCKYFVLRIFTGTTFFFTARTLKKKTLSSRGHFVDALLVRMLAWRGRSVSADALLVRTLSCCGHSLGADARLARTLACFGRSLGADARLAWTLAWHRLSLGADARLVDARLARTFPWRGRSVCADALLVRMLFVISVRAYEPSARSERPKERSFRRDDEKIC